jgi:hypothetical protein
VRSPRHALLAALCCLLAAPAAADAALPACDSAPCRADGDRPILLLSYYRDRDLTKLIVATRRADVPEDTPIYYGGYWGSDIRPRKPPPPPPPPNPNPRPRPPMPNDRYSPIFTLVPTDFWKRRGGEEGEDLTEEQLAAIGEDKYDGRIPGPRSLMRKGSRARYLWGVELGRRWRDRIRDKRAAGKHVVTWQLDELISELAHSDGWKRRQFVQGAMRGVTYGRPQLDDAKLPGIVWATGAALSLARSSSNDAFWRAVDDCALFIVGEEYPAFSGSAASAAAGYARWRSLLYQRGGALRSLSRKYVVGMTPGHLILPGLGGNVQRRARSSARGWRRAFIRERARTGPAGLAEYNFTYANATWRSMRDVLEDLAMGLKAAR